MAANALRVELPTDGTGKVGLNAGSAIVGKVGIDQTTPGTTNLVALAANQSVNVTQVGGSAIAKGHGTAAAAIRVELPTDGTGVVGLSAGSAVIGNVLIDRTTPGTTNTVAPIAGQDGVAAGAGAVGATTQRTTLASDDPAVVSLQILDDWDESDRAKVNPIVGVAGVAAGAGAVGTTTQRVTLASDDPAVTSLQILDYWDEYDRAKVNLIAGQAGIAGGTGTDGATVPRVTLATNVGLPAGSSILGKVGIDQTTPGTTNLVALAANQSVNVAQINGVTPLMGNGATGTGSQRVTVASDNTPFPVKFDQTTPGTTNAVSLAQIGATTIVTGGTNGTQAIGGIQAHDAADSGNNPVKIGAKAQSAEVAAVASGDIANLITDLVGKLIVLPYANPENFVSGAITSAMTGTTSTSLLAAPASGLRNYITQITVSNGSTTVPTDLLIQDGSGGTTLYVIPVPIGTGTGTGTSGATIVFPTPLRQPTTATAIFCANVTTGSSVKASASGYNGA